MLDINNLRNNLDVVIENLLQRGYVFPKNDFLNLENERKYLQIKVESLKALKNNLSKIIGQAKQYKKNVDDKIVEVNEIKTKLINLSKNFDDNQNKLRNLLLSIPNIIHKSVPFDKDKSENVKKKEHGKIFNFDFEPITHELLGKELDFQMDFDSAAKLSGSRFVVLKDKIARLHRALTQFMLDTHVDQHGYKEIYTPYLVRQDALVGTGQLPKFSEDLFECSKDSLWLIPTAEVSLINIKAGKILSNEELPLRFVCHTPCFRREAGSYGRDTTGMLRQHQFEKVELVHISHPDNSYDELEILLTNAEKILQLLELPYRVVSLCSGDIGFTAAKTYDIEVWMPSQNCYREISSCSNTEAFQARRMQIRFKQGKKVEHVHTLNGSGLAVGRTLIAIMENNQNKDRHIKIPKILKKYMNNEEWIK